MYVATFTYDDIAARYAAPAARFNTHARTHIYKCPGLNGAAATAADAQMACAGLPRKSAGELAAC